MNLSSRTALSPSATQPFAALGLAVVIAGASMASAASITALGDLPGGDATTFSAGISGDGSTVVGESSTGNDDLGTFRRPFRWTAATGMTALGPIVPGQFATQASAASFNGLAVAGTDRFGNVPVGTRAFRWTAATGQEQLGTVPGFETTSSARGISANGQVVAGSSGGASGSTAFRWTAATGPVGIGDLAGGGFFSEAAGISADGNTIVGVGTAADGQQAFRWTAAGGMIPIPRFFGGTFARANGVSGDGNVVVGQSDGPGGRQSFMWTPLSGLIGLGDFTNGSIRSSEAFAADFDGDVIVGRAAIEPAGSRAFVWTPAGLRRLDAILLSLGVNVAASGWTSLDVATGVSADGTAISGWGVRNGNAESFLAVIPEPTALALLGAGGLALARRRRAATTG